MLLIGCVAGISWLLTADDFELGAGSLELSGVHYTDSVAVRAIVAPALAGQSVFMVDTNAIHDALLALPTVAAADVQAVLPRQLVVAITERVPVLAVRHGGAVYLVDANGAVLDARAPAAPGAEGLPLVDDRRAGTAVAYETGAAVNPVDARAMLTLAALTPTLLGSSATALSVSIDDIDGYVLTASPSGWRAVFGHYTPTLRPPSEIDRQVQCLETILADGEQLLDTVYLAPSGDRCGTYLPRATPTAPSASPSPTT